MPFSQILKTPTMAIIDKDTAIKNLFWWNALCALFHGTQVVAAIIYTVVSDNAKDFRVPIITHYAIWNTTTGPEDATQTLGLFPLAAVTCAVPFLSFIAHLNMATWLKKKYETDIMNFTNSMRWIEYAFSSTLMFFLICLLFSIYDLSTLLALATMNMSVMFFGHLMEQSNKDFRPSTDRIDWKSWQFGFFVGLVQWGLLYSTLSTTDEEMPAIIWAVLFSYFILFMLFALNMFVLYRKWAAGKNDKLSAYLLSEKYYMILSFTSKSILLWLILAGVNQPNSYTLGS